MEPGDRRMVLPSFPGSHLARAAFSEAFRACFFDRCGNIFSFFDHRPHDLGLRAGRYLGAMATSYRHLPIRWTHDRRFRWLDLAALARTLESTAEAQRVDWLSLALRALLLVMAMAGRAIRFRTG